MSSSLSLVVFKEGPNLAFSCRTAAGRTLGFVDRLSLLCPVEGREKNWKGK